MPVFWLHVNRLGLNIEQATRLPPPPAILAGAIGREWPRVLGNEPLDSFKGSHQLDGFWGASHFSFPASPAPARILESPRLRSGEVAARFFDVRSKTEQPTSRIVDKLLQ